MASTSTITISTTAQSESSHQPFQCQVCSSRFTRHENLKRHAALHSRSSSNTSLPCHLCSATFSRPDLRLRHMKRKHLQHMERGSKAKRQRDMQAPTPPSHRSASLSASPSQTHDDDSNMDSLGWLDDQDTEAHTVNLSSSLPSNPDSLHSLSAVTSLPPQSVFGELSPTQLISQSANDSSLFGVSFLEPPENSQMNHASISQAAPFGASLLNFSLDQCSPERLLYRSIDLTHDQNDWFPSNAQIEIGCQLYFSHVCHFVPILHQPTFNNARAPSHLLLSMLCLAYQYGENPDRSDQAESGVELSTRCFHRARALVADDQDSADDPTQSLSVIQAYLLLEIYTMMYLCGSHSAYGLKTHSKMVSLARSSGLSLPLPTECAVTSDLDSLWHTFIEAESHKRTLFAAHQLDTLWYQFLSIPRQFSHLEIKQELPCPEEQWVASSPAEWAHRKLVSGVSGSPVQYPDAVRRFLSSSLDLTSLPAFDPYGAINITHFLVSSAQEISGWSTMTGMISTERLEPLRTSLQALGPFTRSKSDKTNLSRGALCEASWEFSMIEVRLWSPSHTGGIVGGTMDAVVHQMAYLAPSCEFLCEPSTAKAIQPHIDWFLCYLDAPSVPDSEAPWIMLYGFKAFVIAWQLVKGSVLGSMQAVGVQDGDAHAALEWAQKVFGRRERWQLGKIILACLETM